MSSSWPDANEYSLLTDCPKCGVKKYAPCTTKTGSKELLRPHRERKLKANALGLGLWASMRGTF